ncbi:hypothetical protein B0H19DRAFT_566632 [Mycena capillaripes]|nr:hypothetical protein B0H19DRAFT_566632 [Mycena capillaripes]
MVAAGPLAMVGRELQVCRSGAASVACIERKESLISRSYVDGRQLISQTSSDGHTGDVTGGGGGSRPIGIQRRSDSVGQDGERRGRAALHAKINSRGTALLCRSRGRRDRNTSVMAGRLHCLGRAPLCTAVRRPVPNPQRRGPLGRGRLARHETTRASDACKLVYPRLSISRAWMCWARGTYAVAYGREVLAHIRTTLRQLQWDVGRVLSSQGP